MDLPMDAYQMQVSCLAGVPSQVLYCSDGCTTDHSTQASTLPHLPLHTMIASSLIAPSLIAPSLSSQTPVLGHQPRVSYPSAKPLGPSVGHDSTDKIPENRWKSASEDPVKGKRRPRQGQLSEPYITGCMERVGVELERVYPHQVPPNHPLPEPAQQTFSSTSTSRSFLQNLDP